MKKLNTFINNCGEIKFGDYILFQEYKPSKHDGEQYHYTLSKPILAIFLGCFEADQTAGFNYVKWNNDNHSVWVTNEHVKNYRTTKQVDDIHSHIEWSNYIDILGHWKTKPNWKQIIESYRKQETRNEILSADIEWNDL
jgi:hypothetical protein